MTDNRFAAVGAVVLRENKMLLVRHTYGAAAGKLLNPGGFIQKGELPYDAVKREVLEETGVAVEPVGMISLRCNPDNWYLVMQCDYISGEPRPDNDETGEALFMGFDDILKRDDVTDTAKALLRIALNGKSMPLKDVGKGRLMFAVGDIK
jgi:ADP-ribose pyrophosphatase YjhB (NUDIX family)